MICPVIFSSLSGNSKYISNIPFLFGSLKTSYASPNCWNLYSFIEEFSGEDNFGWYFRDNRRYDSLISSCEHVRGSSKIS